MGSNTLNRSTKPWLLLLSLLLACPAVAGVYKWTDAQGRIQYSDTPPAAASTQLKLHSYAGPVQVGQAAGAGSGVTIYTTFRQNGVAFSEWDVEKTDHGAARFRQLGGTAVPLITVGSEKMTGFNASRFMETWKKTQVKP